MRITNNILAQSVLRNITGGFSRLAQTQAEAATGRRINRVSDDPASAGEVLTARADLRGIAQYRRNISAGRLRLATEEAVLDQVTDLLSRARELATAQGSDTATSSTRQATAAEVDGLFDQVVALGNTTVGRAYIFGGYQTGTPPFQANGTYLGDNGAGQTEVSQGSMIVTADSGDTLLVNSGVIAALDQLRTELRTGSAATVRAAGASLSTAFDQVQQLLADVGARTRQLDVTGANLDAVDHSLTQRISTLADVPLEDAATRLVSQQNTLQAALLSASRVLETSLAAYLR